jgi:hypothetical protein
MKMVDDFRFSDALAEVHFSVAGISIIWGIMTFLDLNISTNSTISIRA